MGEVYRADRYHPSTVIHLILASTWCLIVRVGNSLIRTRLNCKHATGEGADRTTERPAVPSAPKNLCGNQKAAQPFDSWRRVASDGSVG